MEGGRKGDRGEVPRSDQKTNYCFTNGSLTICGYLRAFLAPFGPFFLVQKGFTPSFYPRKYGSLPFQPFQVNQIPRLAPFTLFTHFRRLRQTLTPRA